MSSLIRDEWDSGKGIQVCNSSNCYVASHPETLYCLDQGQAHSDGSLHTWKHKISISCCTSAQQSTRASTWALELIWSHSLGTMSTSRLTSTGRLPVHTPQQSIPSLPIAPTVLSTPTTASPSIQAEHLESLEPKPSKPSLDIDPNHFGVFWSYLCCPACELNDELSLDQLCDYPLCPHTPLHAPGHSLSGFRQDSACQLASVSSSGQQDPSVAKYPWFFPFLNPSIFLLMEWTYTGTNMRSQPWSSVLRLMSSIMTTSILTNYGTLT